MAFAVLVVTALLSVLQPMQTEAAGRASHEAARGLALKAFQEASAQLSRLAAPGLRVTCRGEIRDSTPATPEITGVSHLLWTGVWETDKGRISHFLGWLVSGNPSQVSAVTGSLSGQNLAELLPAQGTSEPVLAPVVAVRDEGGRRVGTLAWWIGDEGVKADLLPTANAGLGEYKTLYDFHNQQLDTFGPIDLEVPLFSNPQALLKSSLNPSLDGFWDNPAVPSAFSLIRDTDGLFHLRRRLGLPGASAEALSDSFTVGLQSVLENPLSGGFKRNASDVNPSATQDPLVTSSAATFLKGFPDSILEARFTDANTPGPRLPLTPIPVEIALHIGLFHAQTDNRLRLRYHVEAEFWNPYSRTIAFPSHDFGRVFCIHFKGLPLITVQNLSHPFESYTDDLSNLVAYRYSGPSTGTPASASEDGAYASPDYLKTTLHSWFNLNPRGPANALEYGMPRMMAGEVLRIREPDAFAQPRGLARYIHLPNARWQGLANHANDRIRIISPQGHKVSFEVLEFASAQRIGVGPNAPANPLEMRKVFEIANVPFSAFTLDLKLHQRVGSLRPFSIPGSLSYTMADSLLVYHVRLNPEAAAEVLKALDLRNPRLDYQEILSINGKQTPVSGLFDAVDRPSGHPLRGQAHSNPVSAWQSRHHLFAASDYFHDFHERASPQPDDVRRVWFDIPRRPPLSIGSLRSLYIAGREAFAIGAAAPSGSRNPFNALFDEWFCGPVSANSRWIHPALLPLDPSRTLPPDAQTAVLSGALNLNSTSIAAWTSLLETVSVYPKMQTASLTRFPSIESPSATLQYRKTLGPVLPVAEKLVQALKLRGKPFASVSEALDDGFFQNALNDPESGVSQGDLVSRLRLVVRSDTFRIRFRGESVSPLTGESQAVAIGEARLQRLPDGKGGCRFQVQSFRWITD